MGASKTGRQPRVGASTGNAELLGAGSPDLTMDAIIRVDPSGHITLVNVDAELLFAYSREESLGRSMKILVSDVVRVLHSRHRARYFDHLVTRSMRGRATQIQRAAERAGPEALQGATAYHGEIYLLTDVVLPKILGKEVAEAMRALRPDTRPPYISGYAQSVLTSPGTLESSRVLLEKPFSESTLPVKACEVLNHPP